MTLRILALISVPALLLAACSPAPSADEIAASEASSYVSQSESQSSMMSSVASEAASSAVAKALDLSGFLGKWTGPEGTSLVVSQTGTQYSVAITNLDGTRTYAGVPVPDGLSIQRDGSTYIIHKGDGVQTGMKWLMEKKDCLIVITGEGYCRD